MSSVCPRARGSKLNSGGAAHKKQNSSILNCSVFLARAEKFNISIQVFKLNFPSWKIPMPFFPLGSAPLRIPQWNWRTVCLEKRSRQSEAKSSKLNFSPSAPRRDEKFKVELFGVGGRPTRKVQLWTFRAAPGGRTRTRAPGHHDTNLPYTYIFV